MKVILQQDVKGQGKKGQMVEVSDGYARNFLLPKKLAVAATAENVNTMRQQEKARLAQEAAERAAAMEIVEKLKGCMVKIPAKAGNGGKLFGSVTSKEVSEALKAQTVAARTYCLYQRSGGDKHPGADVCGDYTCCQAYLTREQAAQSWGGEAGRYTDKISAAVRDTDGLLCLYNGAPIDAVFFSSTEGRTADAAEVWGATVPYLVPVDSPEGEEVPNYHSTVTLTAEEVKSLAAGAGLGCDLSGEPSAWFANLTRTASGRVDSVELGGVSLSGGAARSLFSLRSASFDISLADGAFTFSVTGYGHGVGMSQYGANAMAKEGSGWQDILSHYYTGAQLQTGL